jgi:hypothetical protein
MSALIRDFFDQLVGVSLPIDNYLIRQVHRYQTDFINKNKDHTEFFGGNLTGVHIVRFLDSDKSKWFEDVLDNTDPEELREKIHTVPALQGEKGVFFISGDVMNLSCIWLLHKFHNASDIPLDRRRAAMIDVMLVMQFKMLTSLLFHYFRYPADRSVAEATYAMLTNKYSLKVYGSWIAVLRNRSEDVISNTSIHFDTISKMDNDVGVVRMINDIQGRLRDMLKNIYGVFLQAHHSGMKVSSTSSVIEHDGVEILKDTNKSQATYIRYIKSVIGDSNSFIREELLRVVTNIMPSAPPKHLRHALEFLSRNYLKAQSDEIVKLLDDTLIHSFAYLAENRSTMRSGVDLPTLLTRLRGVYTSSRSTDPELLALRKMVEVIVGKAIDTKTESVIASVRTAVLLYIVARTYTMRHYLTN